MDESKQSMSSIAYKSRQSTLRESTYQTCLEMDKEDRAFRGFRVKERLAYQKAVSEWCLRNATRLLDKRSLEEALQWAKLSALILEGACDPLVFPQLEQLLVVAASLLPGSMSCRPARSHATKRWLHVFDEALPYGGHTAMAVRWMKINPHQDRHSVILLNQKRSVPASLRTAVEGNGGEIEILDPESPILDRAIQLRRYSWGADVVVLHTYPSDILSTLAFGTPGGPPVFLVNHGAHMFWVGATIADLVLNCRGSEYERDWNSRFRGIPLSRNVTLPIPLDRQPGDRSVGRPSPHAGATARAELGIDKNSTVLLTVGSGYKYEPLPGLGFFEAARSILIACQNAILLAVGPEENRHWRRLRDDTGGRAMALGMQTNVERFHDVADIYLEGFPAGTTTALLESAMQGVPCVLAPASAPPPSGTDGVALNDFYRPNQVADYVHEVIDLVNNQERRATMGQFWESSVAKHHSGAGWTAYLDEIRAHSNGEHRVHELFDPDPPPPAFVKFWTAYSSRTRRMDSLTFAFREAVGAGLNPRPDEILKRDVTRARRIRRPRLSQNLSVLSFVSRVTSWLSQGLRIQAYELLTYYLRPGGRIMRTAWLLSPAGLRARFFTRA